MIKNAKWIGKKTGELAPWKYTPLNDTTKKELLETVTVEEGSTLYRKSFTVKGKVKYATLSICGLGYHDAYVNGVMPDDKRVLTPIVSHYYAIVRYNKYDVTELLTEGENVLAAEVCGGWFASPKKYWDWRMTWYGNPRLIAELTIEYEDGSTETVTSDENFKLAPGAVTKNCIFDGVYYDFNLEQPGWNKPGFDDSDWVNAVEVEAPTDNVQEILAPPVRITRVLEPVAIKNTPHGDLVYDFGENGTALPRITVKGKKGDTVRLNHAEFFNEADSLLDRGTLGGAINEDVFTLSGGVDVCHPRFTWHGYRYMMITLSSPDIEVLKVESCVIHSDVETTGTFECDREDINLLHRMYLRTELACLQGVPLDCQQRDERKPWLGDAHVTSELCVYNFDMKDFYDSWLEDMRLGRDPKDKTVQHMCPNFPKPITSIDWNIAYPTIMLEHYKRYGDLGLLRHHFTALKEHVGYYISVCEDGFIPYCWYGDWFTLDYPEGMENVSMKPGPDGHRQNPPFAGTMFFVRTLRMTADIAHLLGEYEDEKYYRDLCEVSKNALCKKHYDAENGIFGSGGQFLLTFALTEHIIPDEDREKVFANLISEFEKTEWHPIVGVVGTRLIFDLFREFGRPDLAYKILTIEGYPGHLNMLTKGRTTLTEGLDSGGSGCHCMFASPDATLHKMLGGITVDRMSENVITIAPYCPSDLNHVKCTQTISEGTVSVEWSREGDEICYKITVPEGVSAYGRLANGKDPMVTAFEGQLEGVKIIKI